MSADKDIAKISSFLESAKGEKNRLMANTGSKYDTAKRINSFLAVKKISEIQRIKETLYELLEDPLLPENKLEEYLEVLSYVG